MAQDFYGKTIRTGDTVRKVGSSNDYTVIKIASSSGSELLDIDGTWTEYGVQPENVIIQ